MLDFLAAINFPVPTHQGAASFAYRFASKSYRFACGSWSDPYGITFSGEAYIAISRSFVHLGLREARDVLGNKFHKRKRAVLFRFGCGVVFLVFEHNAAFMNIFAILCLSENIIPLLLTGVNRCTEDQISSEHITGLVGSPKVLSESAKLYVDYLSAHHFFYLPILEGRRSHFFSSNEREAYHHLLGHLPENDSHFSLYLLFPFSFIGHTANYCRCFPYHF